jgi:hypothetical protein
MRKSLYDQLGTVPPMAQVHRPQFRGYNSSLLTPNPGTLMQAHRGTEFKLPMRVVVAQKRRKRGRGQGRQRRGDNFAVRIGLDFDRVFRLLLAVHRGTRQIGD